MKLWILRNMESKEEDLGDGEGEEPLTNSVSWKFRIEPEIKPRDSLQMNTNA